MVFGSNSSFGNQTWFWFSSDSLVLSSALFPESGSVLENPVLDLVPELDPKLGLIPIWLELVRTGGSNFRNQVTAQHRVGGKLSRQQKRGRKRKRGRRKEKGGKGNSQRIDSLGSFGANLVSGAAMICSTTGNSGWNLVIDLLCLLARSLPLLVMRRRTLILETQLVDF